MSLISAAFTTPPITWSYSAWVLSKTVRQEIGNCRETFRRHWRSLAVAIALTSRRPELYFDAFRKSGGEEPRGYLLASLSTLCNCNHTNYVPTLCRCFSRGRR